MIVLRQLLLVPLLAPLLAVLLIGAINPQPAIRLRLLVWSSPALPLGVWLMLAGGGGGLLSALASSLALRGVGPGLQRQVRRPAPGGGWREAEEPLPPPPAPAAGPSRAAGEPSPTVEVPYRVIRRGKPANRQQPAAAATTAATGQGDGWDQPPSDEW